MGPREGGDMALESDLVAEFVSEDCEPGDNGDAQPQDGDILAACEPVEQGRLQPEGVATPTRFAVAVFHYNRGTIAITG